MKKQLGEIVIAPRVLEKIIAIVTAKVEVVHSFFKQQYLTPFKTFSWPCGVYLKNVDEELHSRYLSLPEYGVKVPKVAVAIQKAVKDAVRNMADEPYCHQYYVAGIVPDKTPKPELKDHLMRTSPRLVHY